MSFRQISALTLCLLTLGTSAVFAQSPAPDAIDNLDNVFAQRPRNEQNQGRRGGKDNMMEQLNLSADQKQRMESIRNQYKDQIRQREAAVRAARQEMKTMMDGNASTAQIRTKHEQISALQQQLMSTRMEMMLAMREVLTPEQRARMAELMKQRREQMSNRRGQRGGGQNGEMRGPGPGAPGMGF